MLLLVAVLAVRERHEQTLVLAQVKTQAELSRVSSALIHELQRERGASAIVLGGEASFGTVLTLQRGRTDRARVAWEHHLASLNGPSAHGDLGSAVSSARSALARLPGIRERSDSRQISARGSTEYFTESIRLQLNVVTQVGKASVRSDIGHAISGYVSFMRGKEMMGQERAHGAAAFAAGRFESDQYLRFVSVLAEQSAHFQAFRDYATPTLAEDFARIQASESMMELARLRALAMSVPAGEGFSSPGGAAWFHFTTQVIDSLQDMASRIEDEIIARCDDALAEAALARNTAAGFAVLLLLVTAWIVSRIAASLIRPLAATGSALDSLARGETGTVPDPLSFPGEFQRIRDALEVFRASLIDARRLTAALHDANAELEGRVAERTAELAEANHHLRHEVDERIRAEADLRLAASVFHNTIEGITITDADGTILSVNPAFTAITGYKPEDVIGANPRVLKSDHHDAEFYRVFWEALKSTGLWKGEIWNRRKNGEAYLEWLSVSMVPDQNGKPLRYVAVFNDVTEMRRKDEHIRHQAYHDALTGLPNRLLLQDRLEHGLDVARRNKTSLAVLFLDLDRFKLVNDSLGHGVGDALLQAVAARVEACVRKSDTVARLGGDEFVVVLSDATSTDEVTHTADRIIAALGQSLNLGGQELHVTTSIGIAMHPQDGEDAHVLMKNADTAMYKAKEGGRNSFRFFDAGMNSRAIERLEMEMALRRAIGNQEFELHYQPKLLLSDRGTNGFEVLVRWRRPGVGLVPPDDFIPLAEETGLILPIGAWVLEEACRQMADWRDQGLPVGRLAVNLSARQFQDPKLVETITETLDRNGLRHDLLEIELTESTVMTDPVQAAATLARLHETGITIAVDDFGTGYSSLGSLKRLPIQTLKIDRSFVTDIGSNAEDEAIVRTIITLAQALRLDLVAEGVETEAQAGFLAGLGCESAQGFLFSRPLPAAAVTDWLRAGPFPRPK